MAFPTTSVLDSGSGSNANPIGGSWSTAWSENALQRISNAISSTSAVSYSAAAWATSFGPDTECYCTIATRPGASTGSVFLHIKVNNSTTHGSLNDYALRVDCDNGTLGISVETGGTGTTLGSWARSIANGDSVGISTSGSTLSAWYKPAGGSWTLIGSVTDSTYSAQSGKVAIELPPDNGTVRITNFGGGTVSGAPTNSVAPALTGHNNVGLQLSVTQGTWTGSPTSYAYQWQRDNSGGGTFSNISAATSSAYTLVSADSGNKIRCVVTATNAAGNASANSNATGAVSAASVSFPTTAVLFSGTLANENPLSDGAKFSGPIQPAGNGGVVLQVSSNQVVPTSGAAKNNQGYWNTSIGAATEVFVDVPTLPDAAGGAILLWMRIATPNNAAVKGYVWWYAIGTGFRYYKVTNSTTFTQIGLTDTSYTVLAGDSLGASVSGTTLAGFHAPATKPWVAHTTQTDAAISAAGFVGFEFDTVTTTAGAFVNLGGGTLVTTPANTVAPAVTGTVRVENQLSSDNGQWSGSPTSFTYQWQRSADGSTGWANISAATASTYTPVQTADNTQYLRCQVTATNANGSTTASSNVVGPVPTPLAARVGQTATANQGTWTGAPAGVFTYQWQRNPGTGYVNIAGAAAQTYVLQPADQGDTVRCQVTDTNAVGNAGAFTDPTAAVTGPLFPVNTVLPTVPASPTVGALQTATNGTWSNSPTSFSYQWYRCDGYGLNPAAIAGATNQSYTPTIDDFQFTLQVVVTANNSGGSGVATSAASGPVNVSAADSAVPTFKVEIAFASNPGDATPVWTDVTAYAQQFQITRGRQHELDRMEAGTMTLRLNDKDRRFDPQNTAGPYYPNVLPMKPVRVSGVIGAITFVLFRGYVERWPQARESTTYAYRDVTAVDGFEPLNQFELPGVVLQQQQSGDRINTILDTAGQSSSARIISGGASTIQGQTILSSDGVTALQHILDVADSETGLFFYDSEGRAVFIDRHSLIRKPYTVAQVTVSDNPRVSLSELGYTDITPSDDKDLITNDWRINRPIAGATQEASDATSVAKYFQRTQQRDSIVVADSEALSQAQYLLRIYKTPELRFDQVTIKPGQNGLAWLHSFVRELGDRVTIKETPPGGGQPIVIDSIIQRIDLTVNPGTKDATMVWGVLPADRTTWFVLDDPVAGVLNVNPLGY